MLYPAFCAYTSKHKAYTKPLPTCEPFPKPQYAKEHGEHFSCHCNSHEQEAREALQGCENEDLSHAATCGEAKHVVEHAGMALEEADGREELLAAGLRHGGQQRRRDQRDEEQIG